LHLGQIYTPLQELEFSGEHIAPHPERGHLTIWHLAVVLAAVAVVEGIFKTCLKNLKILYIKHL
jgi:hypothetical protein